MRKTKVWAYLLLLHAKSVWWLSGGPAWHCKPLVSPSLTKKTEEEKKKRQFFLVEMGGRKYQGIH